MRSIRVVTLIVLTITFCILFSGCGYRELQERVLIQGVGVDKIRDGYQVTVRAAGTDEEAADQLYTCRGASVLEALSSLSLTTGREPFYAHNYLVVFGRSCGEEGLDDTMDFFIRYYNTRPAVQVYLAEDTAQEILSQETDSGLIPVRELQNLGQTGDYNGKAVSVDFLDFVNASHRPGSSPVLPVLGAEDGGVEVLGTAYFQEYKLAGFLSLEETRGYLAIKGDLKNGELVVKGENLGTVTLTISGGKTKQEVEFENDSPIFRIVYQVTADVSTLSGEHEQLDENFYAALEEAVSLQLEGEMKAVLEQALEEDQCDIFGFGNLLSQRFPKDWDSLEKTWDTDMVRCQYDLQVETKVLRMEQGSLKGN
jgi:spore germination protein KC